MTIAVIGAGALGCLFGGRLAADGREVYLLHHRPEYVRRLNEEGVEIDVEGEESVRVRVAATTDAAEVGEADVAFLFVKSHQTVAALEDHADCIGPDTVLVSLQNGLRHYDRLLEFAGPERVLAGVTYQGAVFETPGRVRASSGGLSTLGGTNAEAVERVGTLLEEAGFPVERVGDPRPHIWAKQLVSLPIKPLAALTRLPNGRLVDLPETRALMEAIVEEAVLVAEHRGIDVPLDDPMAEVVATCERSRSHASSMLQDVRAERKTEIDDINGAIVDIAEEEGVDVPVNDLVTRLVRALEKSYLGGE